MSVLKVSQVSKSFQGLQVLKDIHFEVSKGETVAIEGHSGSGKTTLLSIMTGLDQADSGEVEVMDTSINSLNRDQLTTFRGQNFGIIFQNYHLIHSLTALENVELVLNINPEIQGAFSPQDILEKVGLGHRLHHPVNKLSGGEQQRVAIARAMVIKPSIIFADEPTGSLDEETAQLVEGMLFQILKDHSVSLVLITHNPELAEKCDTRYHLSQGVLKAIAS